MDEPDSDSPVVTAEDFDIVFAVYEGHPDPAFILAQHFDDIKGLIQSGPQGALDAIAALELAIERLHPHTDFQAAAYKLYLMAVKGTLKPEHDPLVIVRDLES